MTMQGGRGKFESDVIRSVTDFVKVSEDKTSAIRKKWRENYQMVTEGSPLSEKMEWQTKLTVNRLANSARVMQGNMVNVLVNAPDWWELEPKSNHNRQSLLLKSAFEKAVNYYLDAARFKRHAGTFFLCSLISHGAMYIGWKKRLVQNPAYVLDKTEKERRKIELRLAKNVANPHLEDPDMSPDALEEKLADAADELVALATGGEKPKKKIPPYIQVGCLDLKDINHEEIFWDTNCQYMEDSERKAFHWHSHLHELNHLAKLGFLSRERVDRITKGNPGESRRALHEARYRKQQPSPADDSNLIKLTYYYGPLIVDDEIKRERFWALIANDSVLLQWGEYPYWEPPGRFTPIINTSVRQVPYRATGEGFGDHATQLQKVYDSNWQLACDAWRFGMAGVNVVDYQNLIDKSQLSEGVYPGMTVHVRGEPTKAFQRISFVSGIENQNHPVQTMLEQAIDAATGVNELMLGGSNPYSRTSAAETNARLQAGQQNVNTIALDIEQNFIIPALQTVFARTLEFGLPELNTNPELGNLFTDEEKMELQNLNALSRVEILSQWYNFKVKGFSVSQNKDEIAKRDNETMAIINSGGPLSQLINLTEFIKEHFRNLGYKDPDRFLIVSDSPFEMVMAANKLLMKNIWVEPSPNDDQELWLKLQEPLAMNPMATQSLQQHVMLRKQFVQQMQQGAAPPQPNGAMVQ